MGYELESAALDAGLGLIAPASATNSHHFGGHSHEIHHRFTCEWSGAFKPPDRW